jgi:hypothetical protein
MKINIKQEGGFVGMASKAKLDYKDLTESEQKTLDSIAEKAAEALNAKVDERDMPPSSGPMAPPLLMSPARDTFCYSLSMKKDGKKVNVEFDDTNAPPELIEFFQKYIKI